MLTRKIGRWILLQSKDMLLFSLEMRLKDRSIPCVSLSRSFWHKHVLATVIAPQNQAPTFRAESLSSSTALSGALLEIQPSIVRSHFCTQNLGSQKLSYQIKHYLWANMNSLSAVTEYQIQGNSCLYSHTLDWLQWFQTSASFSLQCIPYHYPLRSHFTLCSPVSSLLLCCIKLYRK